MHNSVNKDKTYIYSFHLIFISTDNVSIRLICIDVHVKNTISLLQCSGHNAKQVVFYVKLYKNLQSPDFAAIMYSRITFKYIIYHFIGKFQQISNI